MRKYRNTSAYVPYYYGKKTILYNSFKNHPVFARTLLYK